MNAHKFCKATMLAVTTPTSLDCWHFAGSTLRDGSPLPNAGETRTLPDGETPALCVKGWHGSVRAYDALQYAPGAMVARVRLHGTGSHRVRQGVRFGADEFDRLR